MNAALYPRQLLLDLNLGYRQTFSNFIQGTNATLYQQLQSTHPLEAGFAGSLCCWSPQVVGKSHLLRAYCAKWQELGLNINYINGGNLSLGLPEIDDKSVVVFDDMDNLLGSNDTEEGILYLILSCYENDVPFICSAANHPAKLTLAKDDLASRIASFYSFEIYALSEDDLCKFVMREADKLGLCLSPQDLKLILQKPELRDIRILSSLLPVLSQLSLTRDKHSFSIQDIESAAANLRH